MPHHYTAPECHPADINPPWEDLDEDEVDECLICGPQCHCHEAYDHWKDHAHVIDALKERWGEKP